MDLKSPHGATKTKMNFILSNNPEILKDVEVLSKISGCDHMQVRCNLTLNLKDEKKNS